MDKNLEHHPFCNYFKNSRKGCKQCETLYLKFPIDDNENKKDAYDRLLKSNFSNIKIIK